MGAKFSSELTSREGVANLKLGGVVDEDNELTSLEAKLSGGPLVLDLSDIDRINSCGVRDWVNWLGRIEKNGAKPVFVSCSPAIVAQINLVHNFTAGGIVKSFYAPYYCPRCEKEKLLRLETRDLLQLVPISTAPTCRCDECDGPMDFDDLEESYFAFLKNAKKVFGDPVYEATMREIAAAGDAGSKMKQRTTGASIPPVSSTGTGSPLTPAASAVSPTNRTPTASKTPPGSTPTGGPQGFGSTIPPKSSGPTANGGIGTGAAATSTAPAQLAVQSPNSGGAPALTSGANRPPSQPAPRSVMPWVYLGLFLATALGLLAFVLLR